MEKFSDFAVTAQTLEGRKVEIDRILNKEIIITGFRIGASKFKENGNDKYERIQFKYEKESEETFVFFTGSEVLRNQLKEYETHIPFITKVLKKNRYYAFS